MLKDTLQRFDDFYWEKGEYEKRPLGIEEYKNFITQEITKALESVVPEDAKFRADDLERQISIKLGYNMSIGLVKENIKNYLE